MATYMIDGRLTRDAEITKNVTTEGDKSVVRFSIAWNRKKGTHFYECAIFGKRAVNIYPFLKKGKYVLCVGEPDWSEYNGKTYETIIIDKLNFVGGSENPNPEGKPYQYNGKYFSTKDELEVYKASNPSTSNDTDDFDIPF